MDLVKKSKNGRLIVLDRNQFGQDTYKYVSLGDRGLMEMRNPATGPLVLPEFRQSSAQDPEEGMKKITNYKVIDIRKLYTGTPTERARAVHESLEYFLQLTGYILGLVDLGSPLVLDADGRLAGQPDFSYDEEDRI